MTNIDDKIAKLNEVFEAHKVKAHCVEAKMHRHFGFFDVKLDSGCKVKDIVNCEQEVSLALQTKGEVSAKPIPELGIVRLRAVMEDAQVLDLEELFKRHGEQSGVLPLLLGETDEGKPLIMEMSKNPHLLIAGATGSGKSCLLHNIIHNIARQPKTEIYLSDPKLVEFSVYREKYFSPVRLIANDYYSTIEILKHLQNKMEKRYIALSKMKMKSIEERPELFYKTVLIIDEVADLILQDTDKKFQNLAISLAQKARAAGIYLIFATQRPSVDVITGLIKANFPGRISCKVSSKKESQIILDESGGEALAGRGDAILKNPIFNSVRFQVAYTEPRSIVGNFKSEKAA